MKDYSAMSDQEIGRLVAAARGMDGGASYNGATLVVRNGVWVRFDPCNNPADAWPIISSEFISIEADYEREVWRADFSGCYSYICRNALRAAMVVFLMMKESENA